MSDVIKFETAISYRSADLVCNAFVKCITPIFWVTAWPTVH